MEKAKVQRLIALIILSVTLISAFSVIAFAKENDYSYPSATLTETVYADELLEEKLGISFVKEEKEFLHTQSGFSLSYNSNIPTSYVETFFDEASGTLTVKAKEYVYVAKNGLSVVFSPVSANLEGEVKNFSTSGEPVIFNTLGVSGDKLSVKYKQTFTISKSEINRILNLAYNSAPLLKQDIIDREAEYEEQSKAYAEAVKKYELYLPMLEAYNEYLEEKRAYDALYAEYAIYLDEYLKYEKAQAEYLAYVEAKAKYEQDYATYLKYLAYAESNQSKIEDYEKYQGKLATVRAQLSVITDTKVQVTALKRTVYDAIMGSTVTSVIENKDLIANQVVGASPEAIDRAGEATENLRVLLSDFFAVTGEKARYNYYITNYEAFRDNFVELFQCLDHLYMTPKVRGILINQGKQEKYLILLAQLYYLTDALSDEPVQKYDGSGVYDNSYVIGKGYLDEVSPSVLIKEKDYFVCNGSAEPLSEGYPISPPKPDYVTMQEPVMPVPKKEPVPPIFMEEPLAPTPVEEPQKVQKPGDAPKKYIPPMEVLNVINAYEKGLLSLRSEISDDILYDVTIDVEKSFRNFSEVTVIYYGEEYSEGENNTELYRVTVDCGTYADYLGITPEKEEDAFYTYRHVGWVDEFFNDVNLSSVETDLKLYPKFESDKKPYTTTWIVDGEVLTEEPETVTKKFSGNCCYEFVGWDKKVDAETLDITYTAIFEEKYIMELADGTGYKITELNGTFFVDTGSYYGRLNIRRAIDNFAGVGNLVIKTLTGEISISYSELILMKKSDVHFIELSSKKHSGGQYSYKATLCSADGSAVAAQFKIGLRLSCDVKTPENLFLGYSELGEYKAVRFEYYENERAVSFTAISNREYFAKVEYTLSIIGVDGIEIKANKMIFAEGEDVILSMTLGGGIRLDGIYAIYPSGEKQKVESSFKMPPASLVIGVEYTVLEYTVSFVSDGKTIATYRLHYGDVVEAPEEPKKASDKNFKYTFIGWSEEIVPVTEDKIYEAEYYREALPKTDKSGLQIAPRILKILVLGVSLGVTLLFVVVPSFIMCIFVVKRRKRMFLHPNRVKKTPKN